MMGVALLMGACRQAFGSLRAGITSEARGNEHEVADLASIALLGRLVFPVGLLGWGLLLDLTSAPVVLLAVGSATVVVALLLLRQARTVT